MLASLRLDCLYIVMVATGRLELPTWAHQALQPPELRRHTGGKIKAHLLAAEI